MVTDLVLEIINQGRNIDVPFEVRVYDDGSTFETKKINRRLAVYPEVVYVELSENVGRAAIRNKMGQESKYKYLLFLDADSKIISHCFLKDYLDVAIHNCVLCGGTAYQPQKPLEQERWLRWFYGTKREAISAEERNIAKGFIITSNNFLIEKEIFDQVSFREELKGYGHEDTLLGYDLFQRGIEIKHINNPLEHTGLENAQVFIEKTKLALDNLKTISKMLAENEMAFSLQMRFLQKYYKITKIIPPSLLRLFYVVCRLFIERNLRGNYPRLFLLDVYKVTYYSTIKNR